MHDASAEQRRRHAGLAVADVGWGPAGITGEPPSQAAGRIKELPPVEVARARQERESSQTKEKSTEQGCPLFSVSH